MRDGGKIRERFQKQMAKLFDLEAEGISENH